MSVSESISGGGCSCRPSTALLIEIRHDNSDTSRLLHWVGGFWLFFGETATYLKMDRFCSKSFSCRSCILTSCRKSIFDIDITYKFIRAGSAKLVQIHLSSSSKRGHPQVRAILGGQKCSEVQDLVFQHCFRYDYIVTSVEDLTEVKGPCLSSPENKVIFWLIKMPWNLVI